MRFNIMYGTSLIKSGEQMSRKQKKAKTKQTYLGFLFDVVMWHGKVFVKYEIIQSFDFKCLCDQINFTELKHQLSMISGFLLNSS